MKISSITDYCSCILFRAVGLGVRILPVACSLFLGRVLGGFFYYFDVRHRCIVYANLRVAFSEKFAPSEIKKITKRFYRNLGEDFIEIFLIPFVERKYMEKKFTLEGKEYLAEAFKRGKGVIFLGMHSGSWEFSNVAFANMGFVYNVLVRTQTMPRLNSLLDAYRLRQGCRLIRRANQTRALVEALKRNEAIGMTVDQGGKDGLQVKFFGRSTSMAVGAVKLALRYDCTVLPGYHMRLEGGRLKTVIGPPLKLLKSGNQEIDIRKNLEQLMPFYEECIRRSPQDYFWRYKIWKYSMDKTVLILSDTKAGHINQAKAAARIITDYLASKGVAVRLEIQEVRARGKTAEHLLTLSACLASRSSCQGCLLCLKRLLDGESYRALIKIKPDIVISCGSSLAAVNFLVSAQNLASSIAVMQPSILPRSKFSLVVMPEHDRPHRGKNVAIIQGSLNAVNENYLKEQAVLLKEELRIQSINAVGLLLGGASKNFYLDISLLSEVIRQVKKTAEELDLDILVTTSRRTSREAEDLVKKEFKNNTRCKFLVIANEKNYPFAVGGILGLSKFLVVSPESISMISEAVAARKPVVVFDAKGLKIKHREFLAQFSRYGYIHLSPVNELKGILAKIAKQGLTANFPQNDVVIREALAKIL